MMKKFALFFVAICGMTAMVSAQTFTNTRWLNQSSLKLKLESVSSYVKAVAMAKEKGWVLRSVSKEGRVAVLVGVDAFGFPIYYRSDNNILAAATVRTNQLWPGGASGLNLSGNSANMKNKLGIWDVGAVLANHNELKDRITQKDNATVDEHSTHVAGTMMASGVNPSAKGMAFGLQGLISYDFNSDVAEMSIEAAAGMLLSNHSYSTIAGWFYNDGSSRWEFRGRPNENQDFKFGWYGDKAATIDELAYNAPNYLMVKSAGNNRGEQGPAVGQTYWRVNSSGTFVSGTRPAGISSNDSYDAISVDVGAKNILTVGAVSALPNGYSRKEDVQMSSFSSWGPTDDGRIKPDIVADGVNVLSSVSSAVNAYASFSGTSMSAPNTTGSLLLLQEYYSNRLKPGLFMRSATLKALAIHTAEESGVYDGPDYQFGWGLLNVEKAAAVLTTAVGSNNAATSTSQLYENTLAQGASFTKTVVASGKGKLQATIVWTDVKGAVIAAGAVEALNSRTKNLVNDLDIKITKGSRTYLPWTLDVNNPASPAIAGDNTTDNVERIDVDSTTPGQTYTITVTHKGTLVSGPQAYSLLISGVGGASFCTSASGGVDGARIDSVSFNTIHQVSPAAARAYTNYTNNITNIEPLQTIPFFVRIGNTGTTTNSKVVKVFIDYNSNGTFETSDLALTSTVLAANTTTYSGNVIVPSTLAVGNILLMRVVLQEASDAAVPAACGTYGKGETQDYTVRVVSPSNDMSISSIISPQGLDCGSDSMYVTIALRNSGTVAQTNIPVTLSIANAAGTIVANLTGTYPGTIPALSAFDYTFQTPVTLASATAYTLTATVSLSSDQFSSNNQTIGLITTSAKSATPSATGTICGTAVTLKVNNPGTADYFWYTSATATQPFVNGPLASTTIIPTNNTYYVASGARGSMGLPNKMVYANGGYNHFNGNFMRFNNTVPILLESVRLYVGNAGKVKISVGTITSEDAATGSYSYSELSSTTFDVYATKQNPGPNPTSATTTDNPADDLGAVFHLGLPVLLTGDHILNIKLLYPDGTDIPSGVNSTGASFFRNGSITSTTTYPVGIANLANFTGNSATGTGVLQSQFYYIFYDLKVSTMDCVSDRAAIIATVPPTPVISQIGKQLVSSVTTGTFQWFLGTTAVTGATASTFTPTASGAYKVTVTDGTGCAKTSTVFDYFITAIDPLVAAREINLTVSPNPNNGVFNLSFEVTDKANLSIEILNAAGQKVYSQSQKDFVGKYSRQINVQAHAAEVYMLKINHNKKNYIYKIITEHK